MAKKSKKKYIKAPQAPRRFKSAYMFFSTTKHGEIREELRSKGVEEKTTNVAKLVSKAWKELGKEDRDKWEEMARKDKLRFQVEKSHYTGPWKVHAKGGAKRDPNMPKRPMSAFLAYSHTKRAVVKAENPGFNNGETSRLLAEMWKDAPKEEKKEHIDKEYELRQKYLREIAVWREREEKELKEKRNHREEIALQTIEAGESAKDQIEGQHVASDKEGQQSVATTGYGGYHQGYPPSYEYGVNVPPGAYSQDYRKGYAPYSLATGQYQQCNEFPTTRQDAVNEGAYPPQYGAGYSPHSNYDYYLAAGDTGGYGGGYREYAYHGQNYSAAGYYDRLAYQPPPYESNEQSRMTDDHYRHGHPSHDQQPAAFGGGGNINDESKRPALTLDASRQDEPRYNIHHDG